jgi:gentisate 1,2-dioxygenase
MDSFRKDFQAGMPRFEDRRGASPRQNTLWEPVIVSKAMIDAEIERLADAPRGDDGRRESLIIHPRATDAAPGLAPGIQVSLSVLKPGEASEPYRHNAAEINFCISGGGHSIIAGQRYDFAQHDVWTTPSYAIYQHVNDTDALQVRLTYSNVPLLRFMQVHIEELHPAAAKATTSHTEITPERKSPFGTFALGDEGAMLMPYELLINPPAVVSRPLIWHWSDVKVELDKLEALGKSYVGRRLYLLYNEMTGRTNGTTPNFFATMTMRPPGIVDRPHRHVSAAINYYFHGTGRSTVAGNVYEWGPGDLMLSAPGWAVHNHASYDDYVYELTVQDQPLNIVMQSLLWQENMKEPPVLLGAQSGFSTNRMAAVI